MNEWSWCKAAGGYKDSALDVDKVTGDWAVASGYFCNCGFAYNNKCAVAKVSYLRRE